MGVFDRLRIWRARERYMPLPRRIRSGTTALIAIAVIVVALTIGLVLERGNTPRDAAMIAWAEAHATDPVQLIERATRTRPVLLLGDVVGAPAPKRLAATLIDTLGMAGRLEAVGLEVPADQQTWIDLYLETDPEDASVLLAHPRTIREDEGAGRAMLQVYRAVWRVNRALGANRRIRIIALDPSAWPPPPGISPARALAVFAQRDSIMQATLDARLFDRSARPRVLVFVDGLHVQKSGARLATGGIAPATVEWLGARLANRGVPIFTVIVDAARGTGAPSPVAGHRAGPLYSLLRANLSIPAAGLAFPLTGSAAPTADWLASPTGPGVGFQRLPADPRLEGRIDAWVILPN
ncbi:MAG: hypothetical protein ACREL7_15550 [Longimicrobiales bacterium]